MYLYCKSNFNSFKVVDFFMFTIDIDDHRYSVCIYDIRKRINTINFMLENPAKSFLSSTLGDSRKRF